MFEQKFEEAKALLIKGDMDESLTKFCEVLQEATQSLGETNYECAKFYYGYANALLYKQEANQDVFGVEMPNQVQQVEESSDSEELLGQEDSEQDQQDGQIEMKNSQPSEDRPLIEDDQPSDNQNQPENDQNDEDPMVLIWENLETARFICDEYWKKISLDDDIKQQHKVEVLTMTAKILKRLGDFLCLNDEFSKAIQEYQRCLEIRQKIDDAQYSRELAELYFVIGSAVLMEDKPNCEAIAIVSFKKGKKIIENNLAQKLNYDLSKFEGDYDKSLLIESFTDNEDVRELKLVVKEMQEKIEDTQLQLEQKGQVQKEVQSIPQQSFAFDKPQLSNNQFQQQQPQSNQEPSQVQIIKPVQITRNIQPQMIQVQRTVQPTIIKKDVVEKENENGIIEKKLKLE